MKKILALICVFAILLTFCGCRETTVETSMFSYFDGEEIVAPDNNQNENAGDVVESDTTENNSAVDDNQNNGADNSDSSGNNSTVSDVIGNSGTSNNEGNTSTDNNSGNNNNESSNNAVTNKPGVNNNSTNNNASTDDNIATNKPTTDNSSKNNGTTSKGNSNNSSKNNGTTSKGNSNNSSKNNGTTSKGNSNNSSKNNGTTSKGNSNNSSKNNGTTNNSNTNNGNTNNGSTNDNQIGNVVSNPLEYDLKGATITIYDVGNVFAPDAKKSKTDSAKADMIKKIQKELNCKFDIKQTDENKLASLAAASAAGGRALCQIITTPISKSGYFISSNLVADINKISSIDLSKDYMNAADMPNATQFGNGKYAVAADTTVASGVVFNKRILSELGYEDNYIYDLVKAGKWTYAEFRKLAKAAMKDLDGKPGMSVEDQWGIAIMDRSTGGTADLLVSANTPMIKLENGKLVSNMTNANIAKVATLMRDTYVNDGVVINDNGSKIDGTKAHDAFKSGKVFMEYTTSEVMYWYSNMNDEFGFVPSPKIDGASSYSSALDWNYKCLMIPAGLSAQEQYNAGAVVQAYMYLMQDIYNVRKNEYVNRYFCDEESGENLILAMKGVTVHPAQCYAKINETILSGTYRVFWNYISDGASVSAAVESTGSALKKALDELNVRIKDK